MVFFVACVIGAPFSLPAEDRAPASAGGSVGLRELVRLALQNDPGLVSMRRNLSVEEARKRTITQWRDPEVRLGLSRDDNLYNDEPVTNRNPGPREPHRRDQTNTVRVRFFVPKPWEMKALVNRAAKEMDLANYEVTAAERRVILDVRQRYEELQFLAKRLEVKRGQIAIIEEHVSNQKALLDAGGDFTLDQLSFEDIKIPGLQLAIEAAGTELTSAKRALAARVGLADGERIRVTDGLLRSGIRLQDTDLDYLTLMAFAHRGEVGVLQHEQAIAEAELGHVKSKRIPWFTFVEPEYGHQYDGGDQVDEAYGVRVAVIMPLFSWLAKEEKVVEARIAAAYASLEANQKSIANEVAEAFRSVKEAERHRARTMEAVAQYSRRMEERAKELAASEDLAAQEQLRYDTEMERYKFDEYVLAADRHYNQSLIRLEQALGADLDKVFRVEFDNTGSGPVTTSPNSTMPQAPEPEPRRVRARPVPEASVREARSESGTERRRGLFDFLKEQDSSSGN